MGIGYTICIAVVALMYGLTVYLLRSISLLIVGSVIATPIYLICAVSYIPWFASVVPEAVHAGI